VSSPVQPQTEPIAGYTLTERIGAGGYGEVWKARAPGGLAKAVKFIYGRLDDDRAACELRALERIKQVRHPFLLSLERIEVVEGQLIILTELADASLKDRFDQCRRQGLPGIPRDELLVYLQDAADALDYMSEEHSLQHLDVKPENLLIVGGRVKVADFGLVKEINDRTVSLMGGLTPLYAAPETFDGHPSRHSDQYSLAIVYQEMLTGVLPFPGRTTAQLMSQHLYSRPRLASLPAAERPIIERALSKDPNQRFTSCRELIEALRLADRSSAGAAVRGAALEMGNQRQETLPTAAASGGTEPEPEPAPACATSWGGDNPPTLRTLALDEAPLLGARQEIGRPVARPVASVEPEPPPLHRELPPLPAESCSARLSPTLVVGIGGTAGHALVRLARRLEHRLGDASAGPAIRLLLIDTDPAALEWALQAARQGAEWIETLAMPLRQPQDYREDADRWLRWLSRRWLYNIPRSLQTGGLRPLGRLALADHAQILFQRLRAALRAIAQPEALAATGAAARIDRRDPAPRLFVLGSISGGTASGMILDVGYAVRQLAEELGLDGHRVFGILAHSTVRNPQAKGLAIANATACLRELEHYCRTGRFPGDPTCNLAPRADRQGPFQAYLVHLGDDLTSPQFEEAADRLAEYLYLDLLTCAGGFFDATRASPAEPASLGHPTVRTFGLSQIGYTQSETVRMAVDWLSAALLSRWCGEGADHAAPTQLPAEGMLWATAEGPSQPQSTMGGATLSAEVLPLQLEYWVQAAEAHLREELGGDESAFLRTALKGTGEPGSAGAPQPPIRFLSVLNAILGDRTTGGDSACSRLQLALVKRLKQRAQTQAETLAQWVLRLADTSPLRLEAARLAVQWAADRLRTLETEAEAALRQSVTELANAEKQLLESPLGTRPTRRGWLGLGRSQEPTPEERYHGYFRQRIGHLALRGTILWLRALRAHVTALADRLLDLRRRLMLAAERFGPQAETAIGTPAAPPSSLAQGRQSLESLLAAILRQQRETMLARLDRVMYASLLESRGGLRGLLACDEDLATLLDRPLRQMARQVILQTLAQFDLLRLLVPEITETNSLATLEAWLAAAEPRVGQGEGAVRRLLMVPANLDATPIVAAVAQRTRHSPTTLVDRDAEIVLCTEVADVSLVRAMEGLVRDRPECVEIATRLHCRTDVPWHRSASEDAGR